MAESPAAGPGPAAITITVDGRPVRCRPDTSVAVALFESGRRELSHSHKYGRPRGLTCARGHCTSCLMRIDGVPNVRTCETRVRDGMTVAVQDTGTFYGGPMQKMLGLGSRWVPVGFYYKWFTRPATVSRFFLERIRPMTGVGRLPDAAASRRALPAAASASPPAAPDLGHVARLVVGGGPSGLRAALAGGGPTLVIDDMPVPGGQRKAALDAVAHADVDLLPRFPGLADARERIQAAVNALNDRPGIRFVGDSKVLAGYQPGGVVVRRPDGVATARCDELVWAAGALDAFGLFPGNDTPGIFGPRALYRIVARDGLDVAGRHALLVGSGPDLWLSAALLHGRGALVKLVVTGGGNQSEVAAAVDLKWPLNTGLRLDEVRGSGPHALRATFVPRRSAPGPKGSHMHLEADFMVLCGAGKPAYDVPFQLGADLVLDPARGGYVPRGSTPDGADFTAPLAGGLNLTWTGGACGRAAAERSAP
ncbi:(2Fe-2S)-binding protein [bacterium]|nr:(2Fe-2S)-binding protein [bacterium]